MVDGDRHVSHHFLVASAGQPGKHCPGGLDAILRFYSQADEVVIDILRRRSAFPAVGVDAEANSGRAEGVLTTKLLLQVSG